MTGADIKQMIHAEGLKCWQVAEKWGVNDGNFSRRLRRPFNAYEVERVRAIIAQIKAKKSRSSDRSIRTAKSGGKINGRNQYQR